MMTVATGLLNIGFLPCILQLWLICSSAVRPPCIFGACSCRRTGVHFAGTCASCFCTEPSAGAVPLAQPALELPAVADAGDRHEVEERPLVRILLRDEGDLAEI